jgi:pyruvate kinase
MGPGVAPAAGSRPAPRARPADELRASLERLRAEVIEKSDRCFAGWDSRIKRERYAPSALNLARYLALRRHELRDLQVELMSWGLSSLGRCESRVIENIDAVIAALEHMDRSSAASVPQPYLDEFFHGHELLRQETAAALGPAPVNRSVRIMATLPSEAAEDSELVRDLVRRGMDVARINCAHDNAGAWRAMAGQVRGASRSLSRPCAVCMDICGPRARTRAVSIPSDGRLQIGDRVVMRQADSSHEEGSSTPQFDCSLPGVVAQLKPGDSVWVNEGKLGLIVEQREANRAITRVTHAGPKGGHLREDKGLNFPDTELRVDPLTAKDLRDLDAVVELADMVGHSFVQRPDDIQELQREVARRGRQPSSIALIAKIETLAAVRNLPELIVTGAGRQPFAVMIARGDLAVELGYRRLAELQEELLWLCEAAHVPVIWATQVLDTFVHKGTGARAEITDAAMAERAECVMLNKGPYAREAMSLLDDLLARMEGHQFKKASRMRRLHSW